jgi:CHAD domain-containing protein
MMAEVADKWAPEVSPDASIAKVALGALNGRIDAVLHYLPLAAMNAAQDSENVHQLRVWTRRLAAALQLYKSLIPKRQLSWFRKELRKLRRAAGDARDSDVLIDRLQRENGNGTGAWLESLRGQRTAAQKEIVGVYERLHSNQRLQRKAQKLLEHVAACGQHRDGRKRFAKWARSRLDREAKKFFKAIPRRRSDNTALHKFRIQAKALRYTIELFAGAFLRPLKTRIYPVIESIQDRLGVINDHATASARFQRLSTDSKNGVKSVDWKTLQRHEKSQLEKTKRAFQRWFTAAKLKKLRIDFEKVLAAKPKKPRP